MSGLLLVLIGLPLAAALVLMLAPRELGEAIAVPAGLTAAVVTAAAAVVTLAGQPWQTGAALQIDLPWIPTLGVRAHLMMDGISVPLVLLTAALGVAVQVHVAYQPPSGASRRSLVSALLAVQAGAVASFLAADLVLFFVAFEIVLVPMWAIIRWWGDPHDEPGRREAATRFVLFTAFGSALMLIGLLVVALQARTTDLVRLASAHGDGLPRSVQIVAAALLVIGLAVKVPVWPLHTWLPAAHTAAPTVGSVLLAGVLLKMGSYGIVRIVVPTVPAGFTVVAPYLAAFGVFGILWGGLVCLVERDLKRLIAFSSVAHMGFVALGIASGTAQGLQGALFANVAHGAITALLFLVVGGLKERHGSSLIAAIRAGLRDAGPRLGGLLAVGCVAGLGLPGLAGFWGEVLAVYGAWEGTGTNVGYWRTLAVLAVLGAVLATAYLLRVLRLVWHGRPAPDLADASPAAPNRATRTSDSGTLPIDASGVEWWVGLPLVGAVVLLGLQPGLLLRITEPAVQALLTLSRGAV